MRNSLEKLKAEELKYKYTFNDIWMHSGTGFIRTSKSDKEKLEGILVF